MRQVSNDDVLEAHVAAAAGVELQGDRAVVAFRLGIGVIDHDHAVQSRDVVVADDHQQILIPVAEPNDGFVFRGGPNDPAALLLVDAASVLAQRAIDFELRTFGDVGSARP